MAGFSSTIGGICTACPAGFSSTSGGLCTPCQSGFYSQQGDICRRCPAGQSSSPGAPCNNCPAGYFSNSGGLCFACQSGFSSDAGSSRCYACGQGQTSNEGGQCFNRCKDGEMWSTIFKRCEVCPASTFAVAGDVSCTRCPRNQYSTDQLPICFPIGRYGGIAQVEENYLLADQTLFHSSVAKILNISEFSVEVVVIRPSTIYYFYITEGDIIHRLNNDNKTGNELMLQFYQMYLDGALELFDTPLPQFLAFTIVTSDETDQQNNGYLLLASNSAELPSEIVPPNPVLVPQQVIVLANSANPLSISTLQSLFMLILCFLICRIL